MWPQIDLGHNSRHIAWIGLKLTDMDFGPKSTIYCNFQQNLRGEGVNFHFLGVIYQRMTLLAIINIHCINAHSSIFFWQYYQKKLCLSLIVGVQSTGYTLRPSLLFIRQIKLLSIYKLVFAINQMFSHWILATQICAYSVKINRICADENKWRPLSCSSNISEVPIY